MILMSICGLLLLAGVVAVVMWGGTEFRQPEGATVEERGDSAAWAARSYLWHVLVAVVAGVGAGVLVAGAGGRLVMRLLAATASDAAQGRQTDSGEIVGLISAAGTVKFLVLAGLFFGLISGVLYMLIRRWLPHGRLGGLVYRMLVLVVLGARLDPLNTSNPDFDIVGPGWVAATAFSALVVMHGMVVAALAARYSHVAPVYSSNPKSRWGYAPLLVLAPVFPAYLVLAVGGAMPVAISRSRLASQVGVLQSRRGLVVGRVILAGIALAALPGAVSAVADIAARTP